MRLWISPDQERFELADGDSHSMTIVEDPQRYGLDPAVVAAYMAEIQDDDADCQFDFETIISLAQMAGWVRVSRDVLTMRGQAAVSAANARMARKAVRSLLEDGFEMSNGIDLEIAKVSGNLIVSEYRSLDADALDLFVHNGRLPAARHSTMAVEPETTALISSALEIRRLSSTMPAIR